MCGFTAVKHTFALRGPNAHPKAPQRAPKGSPNNVWFYEGKTYISAPRPHRARSEAPLRTQRVPHAHPLGPKRCLGGPKGSSGCRFELLWVPFGVPKGARRAPKRSQNAPTQQSRSKDTPKPQRKAKPHNTKARTNPTSTAAQRKGKPR